MKILFVSLGSQLGLQRSLSQYGDVIYWDWTPNKRTFNTDLIKLYNEHKMGKDDLVFMQIQDPSVIKVDTARKISNSFVVNWTGDVRQPTPSWYIEIGRVISLTCFSNMNDVKFARSRGIISEFMDIGLETHVFKPKGEIRHEADIIFMGNNVGGFPLSTFRIEMVNRLRKKFDNFKAYGVNWPHYSYEPQQLEESKIYRGAKIGINLSHFSYERYSSDRILRIIGSGCFCLSHNYPGIELDYTIGEHLDVWNNLEELEEKIKYYLEHPEERERIAKAGCKHVHQNHSWDAQIKRLSKIISGE